MNDSINFFFFNENNMKISPFKCSYFTNGPKLLNSEYLDLKDK